MNSLPRCTVDPIHYNMNNNNQKKNSSSKKSGSKNTKQQKLPKQRAPRKQRDAPAARFTDMTRTVGMKDLRAHEVSYVTGYVYVGDGTHGATDSVYFRLVGSNNIVPNAGAYVGGGGQIPILPCDVQIGQSYVKDIEKHFSRKRLRSLKITLVSLQPSTANSMVVTLAPVRGLGQAGETAYAWATTDAGSTLQNTLGMAGAKSCASWESLSLDLTPYIAGGSGPDQKEFTIGNDGGDNSFGNADLDLDMVSPCAFVIAGQNSTAALRGTNTHYVLVSMVVDYLDFIAGNPLLFPPAVSLSVDDYRTLFRLVMTSGEKSVRESAGIKQLIAWAANQC